MSGDDAVAALIAEGERLDALADLGGRDARREAVELLDAHPEIVPTVAHARLLLAVAQDPIPSAAMRNAYERADRILAPFVLDGDPAARAASAMVDHLRATSALHRAAYADAIAMEERAIAVLARVVAEAPTREREVDLVVCRASRVLAIGFTARPALALESAEGVLVELDRLLEVSADRRLANWVRWLGEGMKQWALERAVVEGGPDDACSLCGGARAGAGVLVALPHGFVCERCAEEPDEHDYDAVEPTEESRTCPSCATEDVRVFIGRQGVMCFPCRRTARSVFRRRGER